MEDSVDSMIQAELWTFVLLVACCIAMLYLTIAQIIVFAIKLWHGEYFNRRRKFCSLSRSANLQLLMSLSIIASAVIGVCYVTLSTITHMSFTRGLYAAQVASLMLAFATMYLVLWLRQTSFYTEPTIRHLTNRGARCVSIFQGILNIFGGIGCAALAVQQIYSVHCEKSACIPQWVNILAIGIQLEIQVALLALFVWPLLKHKQNLKNAVSKHKSTLMALVKRAVAVTAASILVDLIAIALYLSTKVGAVYSGAVVLNLLCTVLSFADYKLRFLPCTAKDYVSSSEYPGSRTHSRSNTVIVLEENVGKNRETQNGSSDAKA